MAVLRCKEEAGGAPVHVLPGEYFATANDVAIVTVLGSCVAACVRDRKRGIGGMNHFMLPREGRGTSPVSARQARRLWGGSRASGHSSLATTARLRRLASRGAGTRGEATTASVWLARWASSNDSHPAATIIARKRPCSMPHENGARSGATKGWPAGSPKINNISTKTPGMTDARNTCCRSACMLNSANAMSGPMTAPA